MWNYSKKVVDYFLHPRNVGEIADADGTGEVGSLACGDMLRLTFKLDSNGRIADAKFKTFGCASAIASSSALTEMIKGKTLDEALKITNRDIAEYLGGLPEQKMHCSVMGREALDAAIANYRGEGSAKRELNGDVVCKCFGVTEKHIREVVAQNRLTTVEQVTNYTKAGGGCGQCKEKIEEILQDILKESESPKRTAPPKIKRERPLDRPLTMIEKTHMLEDIIATRIRPALKQDGGDIELIDFANNIVYVKLIGACATCPSATHTMRQFIEKEIQKEIATDMHVEEVK